MSDLSRDYIGFTYDGVHSSTLGIIRTSNGSRFEESLLPTMQDKTVQIPGGDGTYYFGSYYTQKSINVPFAFDNLTEKQIQVLRAHFGDKKIHELTFDELPYKTYYAKVTGSATIKYIPFNEGEGRERIYKGEGSIQFTCYLPYAVCKKKFLDQYSDFSNINEWKEATGMRETQGNIDVLREQNGVWIMNLYNPGVKQSESVIYLKTKECLGYTLMFNDGSGTGISIEWDENEIMPTYLVLDSKNRLVEGADSNKIKNGTIYNEYIVAGDFFDIPLEESTLKIEKIGTSYGTSQDVAVLYDYYYY